MLNTFDSAKIESILKDSTKSAALELVLTLVPSPNKPGLLVDLELSHGVSVTERAAMALNNELDP